MRSRNRLRYQRVFVEANGVGPWPCYGCDELVVELNVHHIDGDHTNDDPDNLAAVHHPCHMRLHHAGKPRSAETRMKIARAHQGKVLSPEHAAKARVAFKGRKHSEETKAKMSATRKRLSAERKNA